jgi:hypothetical protein
MSETISYEQEQPTVNEQVEQFTATFSDLRKVLGVASSMLTSMGLAQLSL